jgi:hypothetical protein
LEELGTRNEISMFPPLAPGAGLSPFPEGTSESLIHPVIAAARVKDNNNFLFIM